MNLVEDFHTIFREKMNKMLPYEIGHSLGVLLTYRGENTQQKFALNWSITFPIQPIVNKISIKCINFHQFINTIQFDIEKIHRDLLLTVVRSANDGSTKNNAYNSIRYRKNTYVHTCIHTYASNAVQASCTA